jgi:hypothetical protein
MDVATATKWVPLMDREEIMYRANIRHCSEGFLMALQKKCPRHQDAEAAR